MSMRCAVCVRSVRSVSTFQSVASITRQCRVGQSRSSCVSVNVRTTSTPTQRHVTSWHAELNVSHRPTMRPWGWWHHSLRFFSQRARECQTMGLTVATLTRTRVHRMRVSDLRHELLQRGVPTAPMVQNRAELVALLLKQLHPETMDPLIPATSHSHATTPRRTTHLEATQDTTHLEATQDTIQPATVFNQHAVVESTVSTSLVDSAMHPVQLDPSKQYTLRLKGISDANGTGIGLVLLDDANDAMLWHAQQHYPTSRSLYEAEYTALILALRFGLRRFGLRHLRVQMEQSVMVHQLDGMFHVEKASLQQLHSQVVALQSEMDPTGTLVFQHVSKTRNGDSANLATRALTTQASVDAHDTSDPDDTVAYDPFHLTMDPMEPVTPVPLLDDATGETVQQSIPNGEQPVIDPSMTYLLQFDGGSRGNPGASGAGVVIYTDTGHELWCGWKFLSTAMSNNQAEYHALQLGLECARSLGIERIRVEGDSELVIKQMTGVYKVKNEALRLLWQQTREEMKEFQYCDLKHIFRENNKRADWLANNAMDQKSSYGFVDEPQ